MSIINLTEQLTKAHAATGRQLLTVEGIDTPIYALPLNLVDSARANNIMREPNPEKQALEMSKLIVRKVQLEDGTAAFRNANKRPAAQLMAESMPPSIITDLFAAINSIGASEGDLEDLEGKSETAESSTPSTSSQITEE